MFEDYCSIEGLVEGINIRGEFCAGEECWDERPRSRRSLTLFFPPYVVLYAYISKTTKEPDYKQQ